MGINNQQSNRPMFHVTKTATDTIIDDCEFAGVSLKNDGKRTGVFNTKFSEVTSIISSGWHTTWWWIFISTIIAGLLVAGIAHFFRWSV